MSGESLRIRDLLKPACIAIGAHPSNKEETVEQAVSLMQNSGVLRDVESYRESVWKREKEGTTGIGEGVAIPHGRSAGVTEPALAAMTIPAGVDYESLDGEPTHLLFLIAVPDQANEEHLKLLSHLSTLLMDETFRQDLQNARSVEEFLAIIDRKEGEKDEVETAESYDVVAVTACPTGIAHTYMAAEALSKAGKEMGIRVKVETNGQSGVENALTAEEIRQAKGIIIAADKQVSRGRFEGKPVIDAHVADGIHKPKELIERALRGEGKVQTAVEGEVLETSAEKVSFYKSMMNGVSNMLPFVIGGGILVAISFLLDDYSIDPSHFGSNTPIAALFNQIGGMALGFMLPVLAGFIAYSIADRPGFVAGFVGGALAKEGGAGFLGALAIGFIAGYWMRLLRALLRGLPKSLEGIKPVLLYPVLGVLGVGLIMQLLINPPFAQLNTWIQDTLTSMGTTSRILLGFVLGAMMSADMGGPINKAAYVFGTASLEAGASEIMAAVMAGGMIPPLAIALATGIYRRKFTADEKKSGLTNIIMGLSFITEGAIPFAAADPIRVLPTCMLGAGVAGALSMLFHCSIRAPHGGLWVISVIQNPLGYILALVAGTVVAGLLYGLVKKPAKA